MNKTTAQEVHQFIVDANFEALCKTAGVPIREDNPTKEVLAAIKDEEGFKRYLEQSKY